jgi:hypothetical protein
MLTYVPSGDGFIVRSQERALCVLHTKTSEFVPAHKAPDGRDLPAEVVDKHLAPSEWQFHFYHGFFTPGLLKEMLDRLPKPEPDHGRGNVILPVQPNPGPSPEGWGHWIRPAEEDDGRFRSELEAKRSEYAASSPSTLGAIKDVKAEEESAKAVEPVNEPILPTLPGNSAQEQESARRRKELEDELAKMNAPN